MSELPYTSCQLVRLAWGQWLGFFHPMLEGLHVGYGLLWLLQLKVVASKPHILDGQEMVPIQGVGCWKCREVISTLVAWQLTFGS